MEEAKKLKTLTLPLLLAVLLVAFPATAVFAAGGDEVVLEAERVVYEQSEDIATAEGSVRLRYKDIRVYAHRLVYKTLDGTMVAAAGEDSHVTLLQGGQELRGSRLVFDMISGKGELHDASARYPAERGYIHANDGTVYTVQVSALEEEKWLRSRVPEGAVEGGRAYRWENTGLTTCPEYPPHYSLVSRKIIVLPGYRAVVQKPRLYLKEHFILGYPFDYIIDLRGREKVSPLVPRVLYDSGKGAGVMWGGTFGTYPLTARWKAYFWSQVDFEGSLSLEYDWTENLRLYAQQEYSWDPEREEKRYRPKWGALYAFGDWEAYLEWSQAESVTVEKAIGDIYKGVLWRSPELTVRSPRYVLPGELGSVGFTGGWGSYQTRAISGGDEVSVDRLALKVDLSGSTTLGGMRPFWGAGYRHYRYDDPSVTQERTSLWLGVAWSLGDFQMVSHWSRDWVDGVSPMSWDRYSDSEAFFQTVTVPLGEKWSFTARGGYNLDTHDLDEMYYALVYDNNCCYNVQIRFRDDRSGSDDDWAELRLELDAFPSHPFFLGEAE